MASAFESIPLSNPKNKRDSDDTLIDIRKSFDQKQKTDRPKEFPTIAKSDFLLGKEQKQLAEEVRDTLKTNDLPTAVKALQKLIYNQHFLKQSNINYKYLQYAFSEFFKVIDPMIATGKLAPQSIKQLEILRSEGHKAIFGMRAQNEENKKYDFNTKNTVEDFSLAPITLNQPKNDPRGIFEVNEINFRKTLKNQQFEIALASLQAMYQETQKDTAIDEGYYDLQYQHAKAEIMEAIEVLAKNTRKHKNGIKAYLHFLKDLYTKIKTDDFNTTIHRDLQEIKAEGYHSSEEWKEVQEVTNNLPNDFADALKQSSITPSYYLLHRAFQLKQLEEIDNQEYSQYFSQFFQHAKQKLRSDDLEALHKELEFGTFTYNLPE